MVRRLLLAPRPPIHAGTLQPVRRLGRAEQMVEDNTGMLSIAELPGARVNHRYGIYEKAL